MSGCLRIAFLGDLFSDREYVVNTEIVRLLGGCDAVVANLEGPVTKIKPGQDGKLRLQMQPEQIGLLKDWGVTHVTLANNHIFDCGLEGFRDTIAMLDKEAIPYAGAGENESEASRPLIICQNGIKACILPAAEARTEALVADGDSPGCFDLHSKRTIPLIQELKSGSDFLIVMPHWGLCRISYPNPDVVFLSEKILEHGADLIVAHHAHCVQGEKIRHDGSGVFFGLGDFLFSHPQSRRENKSSKSMFVIVELKKHSPIAVERYFIFHDQDTVRFDDTSTRRRQLDEISKPLSDSNSYPRYWKVMLRRHRMSRILHWSRPKNWKNLSIKKIKYFLSSIFK